jgi:hypothetical protein
MSRPSMKSLSVVNISAAKRVEPPSDLDPNEAAIFRKTVSSCDPSHFVPTDVPLLVLYSQAICISRMAVAALKQTADKDTINLWDRSTKLVASLATRPHSGSSRRGPRPTII